MQSVAMKLFATVKNNRGGKKSTSDDTRILVELSYGNKMLGTVGLYAIIDEKKEGYRVVWQEEGKGFDPNQKPILEVEANKKANVKSEKCYCSDDDMSIPHYH